MSRGGGRGGGRSGGGGGGGFGVNREMTPEHREKTLFVGNLDKRITERHLIQLFQQFGELERVQFMWSDTDTQRQRHRVP